MTRKKIRHKIRNLADELTESPEGLFLDEDAGDTEEDLNDLIDTSQQNVYMLLINHLPWRFRKNTTFTTAASTREYSIVTDLSISDFFRFENIFYWQTGEKPYPLTYIEPEEESQYGDVGATGDPKAFLFEDEGTKIALKKTPSAAKTYKAIYFPEIPDLALDTSEPALPKGAHQLIAYDVIAEWLLREGITDKGFEARHDRILTRIIESLSPAQGITSGKLPHIQETLGIRQT